MTLFRPTLAAAMVTLATISSPMIATAHAESAAHITERGRDALHQLEATELRSRLFASHARAVLVFPGIVKAGLVFGGESGNGVLFVDGKPVGFYNLSGGSFGFLAGAESFSYAMFFMNESSLHYLRKSNGWAVGTGPSITIINANAAAEANSTTITKDVYAFPYNGKGLMGDLSLQGTKISRIHPD